MAEGKKTVGKALTKMSLTFLGAGALIFLFNQAVDSNFVKDKLVSDNVATATKDDVQSVVSHLGNNKAQAKRIFQKFEEIIDYADGKSLQREDIGGLDWWADAEDLKKYGGKKAKIKQANALIRAAHESVKSLPALVKVNPGLAKDAVEAAKTMLLDRDAVLYARQDAAETLIDIALLKPSLVGKIFDVFETVALERDIMDEVLNRPISARPMALNAIRILFDFNPDIEEDAMAVASKVLRKDFSSGPSEATRILARIVAETPKNTEEVIDILEESLLNADKYSGTHIAVPIILAGIVTRDKTQTDRVLSVFEKDLSRNNLTSAQYERITVSLAFLVKHDESLKERVLKALKPFAVSLNDEIRERTVEVMARIEGKIEELEEEKEADEPDAGIEAMEKKKKKERLSYAPQGIRLF